MRGHLMSVFPALTSTWTNAPSDENSAERAVNVLYLQKKIPVISIEDLTPWIEGIIATWKLSFFL